jgi:hypothetical protein
MLRFDQPLIEVNPFNALKPKLVVVMVDPSEEAKDKTADEIANPVALPVTGTNDNVTILPASLIVVTVESNPVTEKMLVVGILLHFDFTHFVLEFLIFLF